jgi:hypothetical protein
MRAFVVVAALGIAIASAVLAFAACGSDDGVAPAASADGALDARPGLDGATPVVDATDATDGPDAPTTADAATDADADAGVDADAEAGADADADVDVDAAPPWALEDPGPTGIQFLTPSFDVPQSTETMRCYFLRVPGAGGGAPLYFGRTQMALSAGGVELDVYRVKTIKNLGVDPSTPVIDGECFQASNWSDWELVVNAQGSRAGGPITDWQLPPNVAHQLFPAELLMVQVHFVNDASVATPGPARAGIDFFASTDASPVVLGTIRAEASVHVCQSTPQSTVSGACQLSTDATIVAVNGQTFARGVDVEAFPWDGGAQAKGTGVSFYQSSSWFSPTVATSLNVVTTGDAGVTWTCSHTWSAPSPPSTCADLDARDPLASHDCCYARGTRFEQSERCGLYVYYYPKAVGVTCQ